MDDLAVSRNQAKAFEAELQKANQANSTLSQSMQQSKERDFQLSDAMQRLEREQCDRLQLAETLQRERQHRAAELSELASGAATWARTEADLLAAEQQHRQQLEQHEKQQHATSADMERML